MKHGSVYQRHLPGCPRDEAGALIPHRCRGPWSYFIDLERNADGKRKQLSKSGFPTKKAALSALREVTATLMADVTTHTLTVGEFLDTWIEGKQGLKPSTRAHYRDTIRLYLRPHIGGVRLMELRAFHLDRMYGAIAKGVRGKPLSTSSVRRIHACLRSALNTAVKRRLIPYNPALHVELPPERPKRPQPWTADECRRFLASIENDPEALLYRLLLVTGMRRGEAIGLRWRDLDLGSGDARVVQQITAVAGHPMVDSPKTRRGSRVVPLDPDMTRQLTEHRDAQRTTHRGYGLPWDADTLVFARPDGSRLRPEYVSKHFTVLARRAGLPAIRLHDLRHTNATLALEAGIDLKIVSERLGHATTGITADIYTHVAPRVGRDAAGRIASLIDGREGSDVRSRDSADANASEMPARRG